MVMGRRALREIRGSRGTIGGEGLAQGGFWTGLIGTVWMALVTVFVLAVFAFGGAMSSSFDQTSHTVSSQHPHRDRPC